VRFEMLHPAASSYADPAPKPNARSCTLKVSAGGAAMLLGGDIEALQEAMLLDAMPDKLKATVLLAPHHGSGTSSTPDFLDAVAPRIAVFQVGYRNRYHHPKPQVEARYVARGIEPLRSDADGAIRLDFATGRGDMVTVERYRDVHRRYWYGQ
jgi:competence protein ComEC